MSYALVGSTGAGSLGATTTSVTPAWGTSETRVAGNLLILWVGVSGTTLPGTPSGWNIAVQHVAAASSATIYWRVATGSDAAPTIAAVTSGRISAMLAEFSGGATANPVDQTGSGGGTTSPQSATTGGTDAASGELIVYCDSFNYNTASTRTFTATLNNATAVSTNNGSTSSGIQYDFGYGISTTNGSADSQTETFTVGNIPNMAMAVASFKLQLVRSTADTSLSTDALTTLLRVGRALSDTSASSDARAVISAHPRALADASVSSDTLTTRSAFARTTADTSSESDALARQAAYPRSLTDTSSGTDTLSRRFVAARALADTSASADASTGKAAFARAIADTTTSADTLGSTHGIGRTISDTSLSSDSESRRDVVARTLADSSATADAVVRQQGFVRSTADASSALDALSRFLALSRSVSDATASSDSLARSPLPLGRSTADTTASSDTGARLAGEARAVADTSTSSDALTRLTRVARTSSDSSASSDHTSTSGVTARSLSDASNTSDALVRLTQVSRTAADTTLSGDALTRLAGASRTLSDTSTSSDDVQASRSYARVSTDTSTSTDSLQGQGTLTRGLAETTTSSDALTGAQGALRSGLDSSVSTDSLTSGSALGRSLHDTSTSSDAVSAAKHDVILTAPSATAIASFPVPTLLLINPPPVRSGGGGGGGGGGGRLDAFGELLLDCYLPTYAGKARATMVAPNVVVIDNLADEEEEEEMVILALRHFGFFDSLAKPADSGKLIVVADPSETHTSSEMWSGFGKEPIATEPRKRAMGALGPSQDPYDEKWDDLYSGWSSTHDYDPRWDSSYELRPDWHQHPLFQQAEAALSEHAPNGRAYAADLASRGAVGTYINGTGVDEPVILIDPYQHELHSDSPEEASRQIGRTVDHEYRHALQESEGSDFDEDDAESWEPPPKLGASVTASDDERRQASETKVAALRVKYGELLQAPGNQLWFRPSPKTVRDEQWGRGFVHAPTSTVHTWPEGEAEHDQMLAAKRFNGEPFRDEDTIRFILSPSGVIQRLYGPDWGQSDTSPGDYRQMIADADPALARANGMA